jgi:signal transduction histidine kinase/ligand-binding sensor domain-containing protein
MRALYSRTLSVCVCLLIFSISAAALDPDRQISQYAHTAWRIQDGFFTGTPQAITQTADGYLWIGTEGGLVRFDGVRFVPWTPPDGERLPSARIHAVLGARDGGLWIGTSRGLAKWDHQHLKTMQGESAFIESIVQDVAGRIWVTRSQVHDDGGPLCDVEADALHCHGTAEGISFPFAQPLLCDSQGNFWLGSSLGVSRWKSGNAQTYVANSLRGNDLQAGVSAIAEADRGSVLVGIRRIGKGLGLQQLVDGQWRQYSVSGLDGSRVEVSALLRDRDNGLWIGTANSGLFRLHDGQSEHFGNFDGLSSNSVQGFYEDREGNLWVATARGLDRFHETRVTSFSIREGLTSEDVDSVFAAQDGTIWIGNLQALDVLRNGKLSSITKSHGLPGRLITSLLEDHLGRLWIGVDNSLTIYYQGQFHPVNKPDGEPLGIVTAITEDVDHNVWAAVTQPALFRIQDFKVRDELAPPQVPRVASMAPDPKGGVWLGLSNGGLARYAQGKVESLSNRLPQNHALRNLLFDPDQGIWAASQDGAFLWNEGREQNLNSQNGLPCDEVYTILKDNRGSLWFDTQCGIVVIDAAEIRRWWQHPDAKLNLRTLDVFDGAQPGLTNFRPQASKGPDGKLWFANENILQMVNPENLGTNGVPPPVQVEQILADRKKYVPHENLRLPARTRDLEIDYTALSLVVPEKVRFRYMLEGHDSEWQDPQNRRQAFYTDLPPGSYRFHVVASNNDGIWNNAGAELRFQVLPAFYQTEWFRLGCFLAAAGILGLFYMLRLRSLKARMQARFDERLEERERIARDLHDTLLQGIYSAALHLDLANNRLQDDSPAKSAVQRGLDLLRQVSQEGRRALRSLRPSESTPDRLEYALARLPKEFTFAPEIDFRVLTEGEPQVLRPLIRDEAYLIAREAIINAFRHANASKVEVEVDYGSRQLLVQVRDNGCGIDADVVKTGREGHWGLAGMRERAEKIGAKLEVLSRPNAGTEVQLCIPGSLGFTDRSGRQPWRWLTHLYPGAAEKRATETSEEERK